MHKRTFPEYVASSPFFFLSTFYFVPTSRAKVNSVEVVFNDHLVKGVTAKGKRAGSRVLRRIVPLVDKEVEPQSAPLALPGMEGAKDEAKDEAPPAAGDGSDKQGEV